MWRLAVITATTIAGYSIGMHWDSPIIGSVVGFLTGIIISFPRIIGEVAEGVIDCID